MRLLKSLSLLLFIFITPVQLSNLKNHFLRNPGKIRSGFEVMSSNFLRFQLFYTKWWHLAPGKFFPQNFNSFPRYWGPNFGLFRAKSDSMNEIATLKANICVKNIVEAFPFSFAENIGWIIQEKVNFDLLIFAVV